MEDIKNFNECNVLANTKETDTFWLKVYKQAFPLFESTIKTDTTKGSKEQSNGIDRKIILSNKKIIRCEEKLIFAPNIQFDENTGTYKEYPWNNFMLEYISDDSKTNAPGWMEKNLNIEILSYGWWKYQEAYLLNWRVLKKVWEKNKENWINEIPEKTAESDNMLFVRKHRIKNVGFNGSYYYTWCVSVPIDYLFKKMIEEIIFEFK